MAPFWSGKALGLCIVWIAVPRAVNSVYCDRVPRDPVVK